MRCTSIRTLVLTPVRADALPERDGRVIRRHPAVQSADLVERGRCRAGQEARLELEVGNEGVHALREASAEAVVVVEGVAVEEGVRVEVGEEGGGAGGGADGGEGGDAVAVLGVGDGAGEGVEVGSRLWPLAERHE